MKNQGKLLNRGNIWTGSQEMIDYQQREVGKMFWNEGVSLSVHYVNWITVRPKCSTQKPVVHSLFIFSHHAKHPISEQVLTKLTPKYIWNLPHNFFLYCSHHGPKPHRLLDYSNGILSGLLTQLLSLHYMFFTQESVNRKVTLFCL